MTSYKYSTKIGEKDAAAVGRALPISTKHAIEICTFLRGRKLERAKVLLSEVLEEKTAVPFKRFTDGVGHRKGNLAAGRYPKNACTAILGLLNSAQANAQFKGLSSPELTLRHISAQKGANTPRYGRRRRMAKRTTVEVVLTETKAEKKAPKAEKKEGVKEEVVKEAPKVGEKPKQAPKPEEKKAEEKAEANEEKAKPKEAKSEIKKDDVKKENPKEMPKTEEVKAGQ